MKRFFHSELEDFRSTLALMGQKSLELFGLSLRALSEQSPELADQVIREDDQIDNLEKAIDAEAIRYMSLRSPMAQDLRLLMVGMKVSHDLERVGDEACSIAKRAKKLSAVHPAMPLLEIPEMSDLALEMLRDALNSLLEGDNELAVSIPVRDKEVDRLNRRLYDVLSGQLHSEPSGIPQTLDLIFVAKSIERIADHATNIAEEVIFLFRGQDIRHSQEMKLYKKAP